MPELGLGARGLQQRGYPCLNRGRQTDPYGTLGEPANTELRYGAYQATSLPMDLLCAGDPGLDLIV